MSVVIPRSRTEMQWSPGAAGPLLSEEERAARPRFADDEEPSWQGQALCAQADPDAWFPGKGGSTREIKAICHRCPVRAECLRAALENREEHGVWGGLSERERARLQRSPRPLAEVFAEADERARTSLERSNLKNVRRLAAERRRRAELAADEGSSLAALPRNPKGTQMIKSLIGAGVVAVDIILAMSTPETMRRLHAETHAHQYGTYAVYVVAALLTLWVITSVMGAVSGDKPAPQRPTIYGRPR